MKKLYLLLNIIVFIMIISPSMATESLSKKHLSFLNDNKDSEEIYKINFKNLNKNDLDDLLKKFDILKIENDINGNKYNYYNGEKDLNEYLFNLSEDLKGSNDENFSRLKDNFKVDNIKLMATGSDILNLYKDYNFSYEVN